MGIIKHDLNNVINFDKLAISTGWLGKHLKCFNRIDSTQSVAKDIANESPNGTIVLSNEQTSGKGRLNRKWFSSSNNGLWMSVIMKPNLEPQVVSQLTLLTSVAIAQTLKEFQIKAEIKWPNDCVVNGKKIAGVLTEASITENVIDFVVIGIGINLFQCKDGFPEEIQNTATSMKLISEYSYSKFQVFEKLIVNLEELINQFMDSGFSPIREKWLSNTTSIGKSVFVDMGQKKEFGTISGLSSEGYLLLKIDEKHTVPILFGDVHFL
ncbi:MAG: biotin--[acetyl-CoA-carboxylase] ligase [Bacillales bacterium]|jgi:BirA family biotin operon repressor/biotin-[acetyl-CoA-carboxylase] ligase|nr:biotin--[acetyl-CoA-carboxylase] ligase [Bacillales bacterium]